MTDILKRLEWDKRYVYGHIPVTLHDAIEEITRLRAEVATLQTLVPTLVGTCDLCGACPATSVTLCGECNRILEGA